MIAIELVVGAIESGEEGADIYLVWPDGEDALSWTIIGNHSPRLRVGREVILYLPEEGEEVSVTAEPDGGSSEED